MFPQFSPYCMNCSYNFTPHYLPDSNMFPYNQPVDSTQYNAPIAVDDNKQHLEQRQFSDKMQSSDQMQPSTSQMPNPSDFVESPGSPTNLGTEYTQGYLKTQIGKRVRITFLIGTNVLQDRTGILTSVGISYVILREQSTGELILGDIYSIKFVNIFPQ